MQFLMTVLYFIITLGVLVLVHELGHFLAAKLFRMRVDRFSIGFPPRAFGRQIGETDYCVSWIPIGGYVKIAGMIDESFDTDFLQKPPEPWEFRSKPIWQRMVVISAGVIMNLLLAACIFTGITYVQGSFVRETTTVGAVVDNTPAAAAGILPGDKIVEVDGTKAQNWDELYSQIYLDGMGEDVTVLVQRADSLHRLVVSHALLVDPKQTSLGILPEKTEIVISMVDAGAPAEKSGLKPNDVILALNGIRVGNDQRVKEIIHANPGKPVSVEWRRGDSVLLGTTTPSAEGMIGIRFSMQYAGPMTRIHYSLLESIPRGIKEIWDVAVLFVQQIWQIIAGKMAFSQSVGGPIKIAQMATQSAEMGLLAFLGFMALLSVSLAILNILPFPALDGGHLFFLIYEGIFRREIPVVIKLNLQRAGFILLLLFMVFVLYNDIVHF